MSQATSIAWSLVFGGSTVPFQALLYPQVNVQEQSHIIAESNPFLSSSLVSCQGSEEPCREEGSPCGSSQERHRQQSRGSHHLRRERAWASAPLLKNKSGNSRAAPVLPAGTPPPRLRASCSICRC